MSNILSDPEGFFSGLVPARDRVLLDLEREAAEDGIPIVGPVVGNLLALLVRATGARRVLELGCATGYSAIFLARGCRGAGGRVVTVERRPGMAARARENFSAAGVSREVEVLEGDAGALLESLDGPFDFLFLDIEKSAYLGVLPSCRRLLRPGGLLAADNTAFPEASEFARELASDDLWQAVQLFAFLPGHSPERDGISLALRRGPESAA